MSSNNNNESEKEGTRLLLRMARQKQKLPAENNCWYVDTCAVQHITNQLDLFEPSSFYEENHEFEAVNGEALYCMKKGTIAIPTGPESFVQIQDVYYVLKTSTNLISMSILKRCGWLYLDEGSHMLLIKETSTKETVTIKAKLIKQNIYCLVVYRAKEVIMSLHDQGRPTYLMGTTLTQHLWH